MALRRKLVSTAMVLLVVLAIFMQTRLGSNIPATMDIKEKFTTDFRLEDCKFKNEARSPYFILEPNYQLLLEGKKGGQELRLVITVLDKTQEINLNGIGKIITRVV